VVVFAIGVVLFALLPADARAEQGTARGVIRSITEATMSTDYSARVLSLPFLDGATFQAGDVLVAFDCKRFNAEIAAAEASSRAKQLVYINNRKLLVRGAIGGNAVAISQAEYEQARAELLAATVKVGSCQIRAPFNGRVIQRIVRQAESPAASQPLIRVVDTTAYEIEAIVPSKWMRVIKPGSSFNFAVDETGDNLKIQVSRIGASVDPVSQTIKVYGVFPPGNSSILPGMSGTATFNQAGS